MNSRDIIREHRPVALASGIGLVVAACAIAAAIVDSARAPAWLQLIPSTMTLGGVVVAYAAVRANTLNRRDDETAPARLLVPGRASSKYSHGSNRDVYPVAVVKLRNASTTNSFTSIRIEGVTMNGYGCQQTVRDIFRDLGNDNFKVLTPGSEISSGWVVPKPVMDITEEEKNKNYQIRYIYTDVNGRRWRRLDDMEPTRLYQERDGGAKRNELFEQLMRERPAGGTSSLPADIEVKVRSAFSD